MSAKRLFPKDLRLGILVLAIFKNAPDCLYDYLEIGMVVKDENKLKILILSDAKYSAKRIPSFDPSYHSPFVDTPTRTVNIDECDFYSFDQKTLELMIRKHEEHLQQSIKDAEMALEKIKKFKETFKKLRLPT